jgi:hypothetical protein
MVLMGFWNGRSESQDRFNKALKKSETWKEQSNRAIKVATRRQKKKK